MKKGKIFFVPFQVNTGMLECMNSKGCACSVGFVWSVLSQFTVKQVN